jgi:hypothetical protein
LWYEVRVRREERLTLKLVSGGAVVVVLVPFIYLMGLFWWGRSLTPPLTAETTPAPSLIKDALWARANGGRADDLRAINPIRVAGWIACTEIGKDADSRSRTRRDVECAEWLPALHGIEYLSTLHLRDHGIRRASFRGGAGALATTVWLTRSWTREKFLNTLAARAEFGFGWRGVEAAAQGFFSRTAASLTLPQAAFLAARVGDANIDPWCAPVEATATRNRVLEKMRDSGAIDEAADQQSRAAVLALSSPPPEHRCE